jgi:hypothetical protein
MVRGLLFLFGAWLLFTVFVTVYAASAKKNEVRNLPKWLWILLCVFVPVIGGLLYLALGRPLGPPKPRQGRTRVIAPDDDPQFLRDLSQRLKDETPSESQISPEEDQTDEDPEKGKSQ